VYCYLIVVATVSAIWPGSPSAVAVLGLPVWGASGVAMVLGRGAAMVLGRGATESEQLKASSLLI